MSPTISAQCWSGTCWAKTPRAPESGPSDTCASYTCSGQTRYCSAPCVISGATTVRGGLCLPGLCVHARAIPVFRASAPPVLAANPGDQVVRTDLAEAVGMQFPTAYSEPTLAKIGRNTFSSWEQTGHLEAVARTMKVRQRPVCSPAALAFALLLGHIEGVRGEALFETLWARVLDLPRRHLFALAMIASQRSLIDFRHSGGITVVGFTELLRPMEGQLL